MEKDLRTARRSKIVLDGISRWREGALDGSELVKSGREYIDARAIPTESGGH